MLAGLAAWLNQAGHTFDENPLTPEAFTGLLARVEDGTINQNTGKDVLKEMLESGQDAASIIRKRGLEQISNDEVIADMVNQVLDQHPQEVQAYLNGKEALLNWLFGQVMKTAKGKANPQIVRKTLQAQLASRK